jgi:hypothetical protein
LVGLELKKQFNFNFSASSLTAMENWVLACIVFVFLALVEYGVVLKIISSKTDGDALETKKEHRIVETALKVVSIFRRKNNFFRVFFFLDFLKNAFEFFEKFENILFI